MNLTIQLDPPETTVVSEALLRSIALPLLEAKGVTGDWELECKIVDEAAMRTLNREAQGLDESTDILSFPIHFATNEVDPHTALPTSGPQLLGSLVIAPEVVARQAAAKGDTTEKEMTMLLDHGLRHLLGEDHDDNAEWLPRNEHDKFSPRTDVVHG